ncbi:MAG: hypothetical protein HY675_29085 [Chloroflexi bacterium]|nr:hypothetical protein [Chloroflexota bacterium]
MNIEAATNFQGRRTVFWATSYTFDMRMFDDFWLPRLGDPPLNATLLIDARRLADVWAEIPPEDEWRVRRANLDYLLRGVDVPGWSFHPKTYLFGDKRDGVLLVGSGNLGLNGLEEGNECFSVFESGRAEELGTIRTWREWMRRIVRWLDDTRVTQRWLDALSRLPWLGGDAGDSVFVSNWDRSLLEQLAARVTKPVDEIHVLAPYFDQQATALAELIRVTDPPVVHLYVGRDVSVDGEKLAGVALEGGRRVIAHGFRPNEFVHAKLIGIVQGDRGVVLSGSANISRAALLGSVAHGTGNVEAGVLIELPTERMRALFVPGRLEVQDLDLAHLSTLTYTADTGDPAPHLLLKSAMRLDDERVKVDVEGAEGRHLCLAAFGDLSALKNGVTTRAMGSAEKGNLAYVADADGKRLSNSVAVDDPQRLQAALQERAMQPSDVPGGLDPGELDTPVGSLLRRLNQECIFDIDETPAAMRTRNAGQEDEDDPDFWERLEREELRSDPRASNYGRNRDGEAESVLDGEIFELLRAMLGKVAISRGLRALGGEAESADRGSTGRPWSPDRRLQVRLYNVLERWCSRLVDPRLRWLALTAPVHNYSRLLAALSQCWAEEFLSKDRLVPLCRTLFTSFLRSERSLGYLCSLSNEERDEALATLSEGDRALAAVLAFSALKFSWAQRSSGREEVFRWQPFLDPAISLGVMRVDQRTIAPVGRVADELLQSTEAEDFLLWAATYIDDRHWAQRLQQDLGLNGLLFTDDKVHPEYGVTLQVEGTQNPLDDPRLVTLVDQALRYKKVAGVILSLPSAKGKISVHLNDFVYGKIGDVVYESSSLLTPQLLGSLQASAAGWGAILRREIRKGREEPGATGAQTA